MPLEAWSPNNSADPRLTRLLSGQEITSHLAPQLPRWAHLPSSISEKPYPSSVLALPQPWPAACWPLGIN